MKIIKLLFPKYHRDNLEIFNEETITWIGSIPANYTIKYYKGRKLRKLIDIQYYD